MSNRQKEIVRKRTFKLELSDTDIEDIYKETVRVGITPEQLLENFIEDLIGGTRSNGTDECMLAREWFDRSCPSYFAEPTFLRYLAELDLVDHVLSMYKDIKDLKYDIADTKEEIESGVMKIQGKICTWKDITKNGSQVYESRQEWEEEKRGYIKKYQEEVEILQKKLDNSWDEYKNWRKINGYTDVSEGNFEEEMEKVMDWDERRRNAVYDAPKEKKALRELSGQVLSR